MSPMKSYPSFDAYLADQTPRNQKIIAALRSPIAVVLRAIFAQPDAGTATTLLRKVADGHHIGSPRQSSGFHRSFGNMVAMTRVAFGVGERQSAARLGSTNV